MARLQNESIGNLSRGVRSFVARPRAPFWLSRWAKEETVGCKNSGQRPALPVGAVSSSMSSMSWWPRCSLVALGSGVTRSG